MSGESASTMTAACGLLDYGRHLIDDAKMLRGILKSEIYNRQYSVSHCVENRASGADEQAENANLDEDPFGFDNDDEDVYTETEPAEPEEEDLESETWPPPLNPERDLQLLVPPPPLETLQNADREWVHKLYSAMNDCLFLCSRLKNAQNQVCVLLVLMLQSM